MALDRNPHGICTWDTDSACDGCEARDKLACKWDRAMLRGFCALSFPPLLVALFGMVLVGILTGAWWPLIAYVVYFFLMLGVFEIRFLCSHCPYYAENSRVLHCLANHGSLKWWCYRPGLMSRLERFLMHFLVTTVFLVFPMAILGHGIWFLSVHYVEHGLAALLGLIGITTAFLFSSLGSYTLLRIFYCSRRVNFSCPFNTVPRSLVNAYLDRNEVMRAAWAAAGTSTSLSTGWRSDD